MLMRTTSFSVTRLSLGLAIAGLTLVGCSREEAPTPPPAPASSAVATAEGPAIIVLPVPAATDNQAQATPQPAAEAPPAAAAPARGHPTIPLEVLEPVARLDTQCANLVLLSRIIGEKRDHGVAMSVMEEEVAAEAVGRWTQEMLDAYLEHVKDIYAHPEVSADTLEKEGMEACARAGKGSPGDRIPNIVFPRPEGQNNLYPLPKTPANMQ